MMKRFLAMCAAVLSLTAALPATALAAEIPAVCYPTAVERSADGTEIRKIYDLGPEDDPGGIPRSDFDQGGFRYTLTDLLKQELPEYQEKEHMETMTFDSPRKDMETVLALLPQEQEFVTEDGFSGTLKLRLDTVQVDAAGYGSSTKNVTATRSYPNLDSQDLANIPKTIEDNGRTMTLQTVDWQTDSAASVDGYELGERFTAVATYGGTATSSYVTGYTVTAEYAGTVSKIALDEVRYVAVFEGTAIEPAADVSESSTGSDTEMFGFNWLYVALPLSVIAVIGGGIGTALCLKRRHEQDENEEETE